MDVVFHLSNAFMFDQTNYLEPLGTKNQGYIFYSHVFSQI